MTRVDIAIARMRDDLPRLTALANSFPRGQKAEMKKKIKEIKQKVKAYEKARVKEIKAKEKLRKAKAAVRKTKKKQRANAKCGAGQIRVTYCRKKK